MCWIRPVEFRLARPPQKSVIHVGNAHVGSARLGALYERVHPNQCSELIGCIRDREWIARNVKA